MKYNLNLCLQCLVMKYQETSFTEYINAAKSNNLFKTYSSYYSKYSKDVRNIKNLIFYGPDGVGKYTQSLLFLSRYSPSKLKYERKCILSYSKDKEFKFKMSDIHCEIDFELLGCSSLILWNTIYEQIQDIVKTKTVKKFFVMCRNFNKINEELIQIFYKYISTLNTSNYIKFIFITKNISFIPTNILDACDVFYFKRPTKKKYIEITGNKTFIQNADTKNIRNIKDVKTNNSIYMNLNKNICDKIIEQLVDIHTIDLHNLRESIYDILIYNLDVYECLTYIIKEMFSIYKPDNAQQFQVNIKLFETLRYYNNNYRPIYHLEKILLYLCKVVNGF